MKSLPLIFWILLITSCTNRTQEKAVNSTPDSLKNEPQNIASSSEIIRHIKDTSILNTTDRTIDILFNGVQDYLGGHASSKLNFSTECMICEPVQAYRQGFLFGKRLYVTKDSITLYRINRKISDTTDIIKLTGYYGKGENKKFRFSQGSLTMKYQGQSCNDTDFVSVNLTYDKGSINFNKLINASFFEYDLDKDGRSELYLLGTRNCSQELVLLRINNDDK